MDVYRIYVTGRTPFSAKAFETETCCLDPILYLFDADHLGVLANDDCGGICDPASSPVGTARLPGDDPVEIPAGFYFLAVTAGCVGEPSIRPLGASGPLFPEVCQDIAVVGPLAPGGASPVAGWVYEEAWVGSIEFLGDYRVVLTGVAVPEPGPAWLGLAGLATLRLLRPGRRPRLSFAGRSRSGRGGRAGPGRADVASEPGLRG